jgi:predicted phage tail protein
MPPRRPSPTLDLERVIRRMEDRSVAAFDALLAEIGEVRKQVESTQFDVRKGNQAREALAQRLTDLEYQLSQTREQMQLSDVAGQTAGRHVAETAVAAAEAVAATAVSVAADVAKASPRSVWRTKLGLITATSAAFVAIVAFFNNLPQFVRGASEVVVASYHFIVGHK